MSTNMPLVVLVSGRGSNLQALLAARAAGDLPVDFRCVVSNRPAAPALDHARRAGVATETVDHRAFSGRGAFDAELARIIDRHAPGLIVMAGFMRILSDEFIDRYSDRLLNIHPSLLPALPGLNTHQRALEAGVTEHGATVHFVTRELDAGPGVVQARVPVRPGDDAAALAERVLEREHRIYPLAVRWFAEGRLRFDGQTVFLDGHRLSAPIVDPPEAVA